MKILVNYTPGHAGPKIMRGFVKAFRRLGHDVTDIGAGEAPGDEYDMIIGYSGTSVINMGQTGYNLAHFMNARLIQYWADDTKEKEAIFREGLILQSDKGCSEAWNELGIKNRYLPLAVDEEIFFPVDTEKEFDVILTGVPSEPRLKALDELKGLDIAIFGQWENCWDKYPRFKELYRGCAQTLEELNMLYNKSKVCIDVSTPQNLNSANFTVFNAMASGSVLVTNYKPALEELFGDSKPPFFKGSCRKIVEKYVNDPLLAAEESARQGKTVKEKHTFLERAKLVLKYMADTPPLSLPPELARQFREFCEKKT